ncbi:MAG: hypothetical protein LQ346_007958 [Caloplaca aetnensis]|nr:MAG: hypothetical protein LQ346_007958 [Caloplaca aetnensis]
MSQLLSGNADSEIYSDSVNAGQHLNKAGSNRLADEVRQDRNVPRNLKLLDFTLVNQAAWPYLQGVHKTAEALALARESLGLPPVAHPSIENSPFENSGSLGTNLVEDPVDLASTTDREFEVISGQDISSRPNSRGKKRSRDEVSESLEPQDNLAGAKRQRSSAEDVIEVGNASRSISNGSDGSVYSGATGPESITVFNSIHEKIQESTEQEYSPSGPEETARSLSQTPASSVDHELAWEETATLSAAEEEFITWLIENDAVTTLDIQGEDSEPETVPTSHPNPLLQPTPWNVADPPSISAPVVAAGEGQQWPEPIVKEEEEDDFGEPIIKEEEDIDDIPDSFAHVQVEWADDGYPIWC